MYCFIVKTHFYFWLGNMKTSFNRKNIFHFFIFGFLILILHICSHSYAAELHSPWDSLPNKKQRAEQRCPIAKNLSSDLEAKGYYEKTATGVVVNQERRKTYSKDSAPYRNAAKKVISLADDYQKSGNTTTAECASAWLLRMAKDDALGGRMKGAQAEYLRAWMLNAYATAWLKIRSGLKENDPSRKSVPNWLNKLARATMEYQTRGNRRNNLRYWAGLAVMSSGIASDDKQLFDWGINSYNIGINQIAPDGALPEEMKRGTRALGYHVFATGPLVMIAELAMANNIDLYKENDRALGRLVAFTLLNIKNSELIEQRTGISQKEVKKLAGMAWLHVYAKRFPNESYLPLLHRFPVTAYLYLGGELPLSASIP